MLQSIPYEPRVSRVFYDFAIEEIELSEEDNQSLYDLYVDPITRTMIVNDNNHSNDSENDNDYKSDNNDFSNNNDSKDEMESGKELLF